MKHRQPPSRVNSWSFVCLVGNTEVQFSQLFIDFPLNHDHSDGKKQGQEFLKLFFLFVYTSTNRVDYPHLKCSQEFAGAKSLWVSQIMNF